MVCKGLGPTTKIIILLKQKCLVSKRSLENKQYHITELVDVRPFDSYVLVVMDYFAVYIPQVWAERFHYLHTVLKPESGWKESSVVTTTTGGLKAVNLTDDLLRCFYKVDENIDFSYFHECFHLSGIQLVPQLQTKAHDTFPPTLYRTPQPVPGRGGKLEKENQPYLLFLIRPF